MDDWPMYPGGYRVSDRAAPIAACTLTDHALADQLAGLPGVAIAGWLHTANVGIERVVANLITNPNLRFLLVCGPDSPLFGPGQTLVALATHGVGADKHVLGASGYEPVLHGLTQPHLDRFQRQIEVVNQISTTSLDTLAQTIRGLLARDPGPLPPDTPSLGMRPDRPKPPRFTPIRPGDRRDPVGRDPAGYFVISLDPAAHQVVVHHYRPDHTPAHEMRGHSAQAILAGLIREGLVTQLTHAGYLGAELAKAHTALRLGLGYQQDQPLRAQPTPVATSGAGPQPPTGGMGPLPAAPAELLNAALGEELDLALEITLVTDQRPAGDAHQGALSAVLLYRERSRVYHRTIHTVTLCLPKETKIVMGDRSDVGVGAIVQAHGRLIAPRTLAATRLAVLTRHITLD